MNWYTDHVALVSTLRSENVPGKISEWQLALSEFEIRYPCTQRSSEGSCLWPRECLGSHAHPSVYLPVDHGSVDLKRLMAWMAKTGEDTGDLDREKAAEQYLLWTVLDKNIEYDR